MGTWKREWDNPTPAMAKLAVEHYENDDWNYVDLEVLCGFVKAVLDNPDALRAIAKAAQEQEQVSDLQP